MKSVKECIEHVLEGVKPQPESVLAMLGSIHKEKAIKFAELTAEPLSFSCGSSGTSLNSIIRTIQTSILRRINKAYSSYLFYRDKDTPASGDFDHNSLKIECVDLERNLWKATFNLDVYDLNRENYSSDYKKITTMTQSQSRAGKISKLIQWAFDTLENEPKLRKLLKTPLTDAYVNEIQKEVAELISSIKEGKKAWLYFVNTDYKEHYLQFKVTQSLNSCMAYNAENFGTILYDEDKGFTGLSDGDLVHPLDGYDYAPHFALGLLSKYSPDELREMLNEEDPRYPFDARVVVSLNDSNELAFARCYGVEGSYRTVCNVLREIEKPIGALLFGNAVGGYTDNCCRNSTDDTAMENIEKRDNDYFLMSAPYVDSWSNHYEPKNVVFKHPATGRYVMMLEVKPPYDCDLICLAIYHENGLLRASDVDEEQYPAAVDMNGDWKIYEYYRVNGSGGDDDDSDW